MSASAPPPATYSWLVETPVATASIVLASIWIGVGAYTLFRRLLYHRTSKGVSRRTKIHHFFYIASRIGWIIEAIQILLAVFVFICYIVDTYNVLEISSNVYSAWRVFYFYFLIIAVSIFIADYIFRYYLARSKIKYVITLVAITDILTIVPTIAQIIIFNDFEQTQNPLYLRLVRLVELLRVLGAIGFVGKRDFGVRHEIFMLFFVMLTLIFIAAGIYQAIESTAISGGSYPYHMALYYCLIETLGRPNIPATTVAGYIALMFLVVASVVLIPKQIASLINAMGRETPARRKTYKTQQRKHIVITSAASSVDFSALNLILHEFYHSNRGPRVCDVVLLFDCPIERNVEFMTQHPNYIDVVHYLEGSPLHDRDLARASTSTAVAVMVISEKTPMNEQWADAQTTALITAVKSHTTVNKNSCAPSKCHPRRLPEATPPQRLYAQIILPMTRDSIKQMPFWDPRYDVLIVITELTSVMLALTTLYKGMSTLLFNFFSRAVAQQDVTQAWYAKYLHGANHAIYPIKAPNHMDYTTVAEVAKSYMKTYGIILIAAEVFVNDQNRQIVLFPGSRDTLIRTGDYLFLIGKDMQSVSRIINEEPPPGFASHVTLNSYSQSQGFNFRSLRNFFHSERVSPTVSDNDLYVSAHEGDLSSFGVPSRRFIRGARSDDRTGRTNSLNVQFKIPSGIRYTKRSSTSTSYGESISLGEEDEEVIPQKLRKSKSESSVKHIVSRRPSRGVKHGSRSSKKIASIEELLTGHIVIFGRPSASLLSSFIKLVKRKKRRTIVLLDPKASDFASELENQFQHSVYVWSQLTKRTTFVAGGIILVDGNPHSYRDLGKVRTSHAETALVLPSIPQNVYGNLGANVKQVVDTHTILTTNVVSNTNPGLWTVTELLEGTNARLLHNQHLNYEWHPDACWLDAPPLNVQPLFAAGQILAPTTFDRFLVEAFFNPLIVPLIGKMVFGDIFDNSLFYLRLTKERSYGELTELLLTRKIMPLGIFRKHRIGSYAAVVYGDLEKRRVARKTYQHSKRKGSISEPISSDSEPGESWKLPFVLANPSLEEPIHLSDMIFVCGSPHCDVWDLDMEPVGGLSDDSDEEARDSCEELNKDMGQGSDIFPIEHPAFRDDDSMSDLDLEPTSYLDTSRILGEDPSSMPRPSNIMATAAMIQNLNSG